MEWQQLAFRLVVAALAGMLVGLDREWREKAAGFRTLTLVSAGSALFVLAALAASPAEGVRMMAGIATGIGFLGAGTIRRSEGEVLGLTTAASVWVSAALGVAAALGQWSLVVAGTALGIVVLSVLALVPFERVRQEIRIYALTWSEGVDVGITLSSDPFVACGLGAQVAGVSTTEGNRTTVTWRVSGERKSHLRAVEALSQERALTDFEMRD